MDMFYQTYYKQRLEAKLQICLQFFLSIYFWTRRYLVLIFWKNFLFLSNKCCTLNNKKSSCFEKLRQCSFLEQHKITISLPNWWCHLALTPNKPRYLEYWLQWTTKLLVLLSNKWRHLVWLSEQQNFLFNCVGWATYNMWSTVNFLNETSFFANEKGWNKHVSKTNTFWKYQDSTLNKLLNNKSRNTFWYKIIPQAFN